MSDPALGPEDAAATLVVKPRTQQLLGWFFIVFGTMVYLIPALLGGATNVAPYAVFVLNILLGLVALRSELRMGPAGVHIRNGVIAAEVVWDDLERLDLDLVAGTVRLVTTDGKRNHKVRYLTGRLPARTRLAEAISTIAVRNDALVRVRERGQPALD